VGCNCGGNQNKSSSAQAMQSVGATQGAMAMSQIQDMELEMVRYMHPNRGEHPVYGGASRKFYGNRKGGGTEQFLVHRADIAATPHYFHVVSDIPTPPTITIKPPPPPAALVETPPPPVIDPEPVNVPEIETMPPAFERALDASRFDLDILPGVTPAIKRSLTAAMMETPQDIIDAGVEGLMDLKHIGEVRATLIHKYVSDTFGPAEEDEADEE